MGKVHRSIGLWSKNMRVKKQQNLCCFRWSLMPLWIFMKIFGMSLDEPLDVKRSPIQKVAKLFCLVIGFATLISNLFINFMSVDYDVQVKQRWLANNGSFKQVLFGENEKNKQDKFLFFYFNGPLFEHFAQLALVSGNHLIFFLTLLFTDKGKKVWSLLIQIQQRMRVNEYFHRKCRKQCFLALGLLVPSVILVHAVVYFMPIDSENLELTISIGQNIEHYVNKEDFLSYSYWYLGYPISQPVAYAMFCVSQYGEMAIQLTFFVLISTVALLLKELVARLEKICSSSNLKPIDYSQVSESLEHWNRHYDLVCQLIEEINECFNPILFITIGYLFITSSTSAAEVVRARTVLYFIWGFESDEAGYYLNSVAIIKAGQVLLRLFIFLVPIVILKNQVGKVGEELKKFQGPISRPEIIFFHQVHNVYLKVSLIEVSITALDMIEVNLALVSLLAVTTFDYTATIYEAYSKVVNRVNQRVEEGIVEFSGHGFPEYVFTND